MHGLELTPTDEPGWLARGLARKDSDPPGALSDFEEMLKLNPRSFAGLQNKAALLADKFKDDAGSLQIMEKTIALYPESVLALGGRGVLLARAGRRAAQGPQRPSEGVSTLGCVPGKRIWPRLD